MTRVRFAFGFALLVVASMVMADDVALTTAPRGIDVVVTDRGGTRIAGLTQSDFQIYEDGKLRDIAHFAPQTREADLDVQPRRNIMLIFDETSISLSARRRTVEALKAFVNTRVRPVDRVMVVTILGIGGVFPATSWTSNKDDILAALDKAEAATIGNKGFERRQTEDHIRQTISIVMQEEQTNGNLLYTFDSLMQPGRQYAGIMYEEARAAAGAVNEALSYLGGGPGKKIVVIAGGGLSTRPGADIFQYLDGLRQQAMMGQFGQALARGAQTSNPISEGSRYEITDIVRAVAKSAHDRGIVIYAIDPDTSGSSTAPVERTSAADTTEEFVGVADRLSGYQILAGSTGGLTLTGQGTSPIDEISHDLDTHYILNYTQSLNAKGQLPNVEVRLTKPGYRVRSGFTGGPATKEAEIQDTVIANQAAGAVWSNDLAISLYKDKPVPDADGTRVKIVVMIPMKSLKFVQEGAEASGGFNVYISTGDDKGRASAINRQVKDIRVPADKLEAMKDKTIGFSVDVVMKPGRNQISVGVMDQRTQATGFAKTTI